MYRKISDYAIIGNLHSVALIALDGSIDWLCLPDIDSPSVFAALLDDEKGGFFSITPKGEWNSEATYLKDTNILKTKFTTATGTLILTDFMPICFCGRNEEVQQRHELYRLIEVTEGKIIVNVNFEPKFDYARVQPSYVGSNKKIKARANGEVITLYSTKDMDIIQMSVNAQWELREGEKVWLLLKYGEDDSFNFEPLMAEKTLKDTEIFWREWLNRSETVMTVDLGEYRDMVNRSALTLKLLYYNPTGSIAAAATTSLPEEIGGVRNWDYRYSWLRDTSFTLQSLFSLGHITEMEGFLGWLKQLISKHGTDKIQVMYGLRGEEYLPERELNHLNGYKGSRPVRIGNGAAKQRQLDIYGEIMEAALKLSDYVGKINRDTWLSLMSICDYVVKFWKEKDHGIWEIRAGPYHFVYSKIMCWVALDRGITIARRYGFPADIERWEQTKSAIKAEVLNKGFNEKKRSFVQHYETDILDSSSLLIPLLGFLPFSDQKVKSTLETVRHELENDGFLYRYRTHDGVEGREGVFLLCSFWLINNLIAVGKLNEAEKILKKIESCANHVSLFSEEYDVRTSEQLGNFPQAFTHIGYINSVIELCKAKSRLVKEQIERKRRPSSLFFFRKITLNDGEPLKDFSSKKIIKDLKSLMNILRGAFFDTPKGRISYELMKRSNAYKEYVRLSYNLKLVDLGELKVRQEQIAFWINLYNVIVIHGVIELGIRDSVKEVRNFFKRIRYKVRDMFFSPDDIEHGILRGNRRKPHSILRHFKKGDKRLNFVIQPMDPRIHFALVCASSSCPPIDIYDAENLDEQLKIAGETFLNSGGIIIDKVKNKVFLSRIFKWYADDFGKDIRNILGFIAPYLYNEKDKNFLEQNTDSLEVIYQEYDWRLNRY